MKSRYESASTFEAALDAAQRNQDLWRAVYKQARVPEPLLERVRALGGHWHLLVLSEDWCGDAVNSVPLVARLAELAPNVDMRVLARDENPDLMDTHLTGSSRSIPVVMIFDEDFVERGWWGPRPSELQAWVLGPGKALPPDDKYREVRRWYARDRGLTTLTEIVALMEEAARRAPEGARAAG